MRKLASIQKISNLEPIEGADLIERASILGWHVVVKKGDFEIGDLCVFCEIDSQLPQIPEFEFLAKSKYRIKTIKLKGQISQGLCLPLSILPDIIKPLEGLDVTDILCITKYEPKCPKYLKYRKNKEIKGVFPSYVPKTDAIRIQSVPDVLEELKGVECYVTVKIDGTSATFCQYENELDICSRNLSIKEGCNIYWDMYHKYNMQEIFNQRKNIAIQGEIAGFWRNGGTIQKNPLKLKETDLFVFDVFDIKERKYYDFDKLLRFCEAFKLQMVPIEFNHFILDHTVNDLLTLAEGDYVSGRPREGLVFRPKNERYSHKLKGRANFKVINNHKLNICFPPLAFYIT